MGRVAYCLEILNAVRSSYVMPCIGSESLPIAVRHFSSAWGVKERSS